MSGQTIGLTSLEVRKQMLLIESNLNRAMLLAELAEVKNEVHQLTEPLRSLGSLAAMVTQVGTTVAAFFKDDFPGHRPSDDQKPAWLGGLLRTARLGASLWSEWRTHGR